MVKESVACWMIIDREWVNYKAGDSHVIGIFFTYEEARKHLEELIDKTTREMKENALLKGYSITTYWDDESNCDHGASIICEPEKNDEEYCYDIAIEQTEIFADWSKVIRSPFAFAKKLNVIRKESA